MHESNYQHMYRKKNNLILKLIFLFIFPFTSEFYDYFYDFMNKFHFLCMKIIFTLNFMTVWMLANDWIKCGEESQAKLHIRSALCTLSLS